MPGQLTAYFDFKSPYAYLAVEHTRALGAELGIEINWMPFVLDIPSYLGSAKLDDSGKVAEQSRSSGQWSRVKYAYYDCRRYATLAGRTLRGTVKIWDTNLAAIGMLWAKQQGDEVLQRYIDGIYVPFWKRELDVEDVNVIEQVLAAAGASHEGFAAYCADEGARENAAIQRQAFDSGIFGVPTYVIGDDRYFGREHLPRIKWLLQGSAGPCPDVAYSLLPTDQIEPTEARTLHIGLALEEPESLLAIPRIVALAENVDVQLCWYALPAAAARPERGAPDDNSRGARHRRFRAENRSRDRLRYLPAYDAAAELEPQVRDMMHSHGQVFESGAMPDPRFSIGSSTGYVGSPVFLLGEETFIGRHHLPLIGARLQG